VSGNARDRVVDGYMLLDFAHANVKVHMVPCGYSILNAKLASKSNAMKKRMWIDRKLSLNNGHVWQLDVWVRVSIL